MLLGCSIVNVIGSSIARITHSGSYIHAGPEIGVVSTKAFTSQLSVLTLLALYLGRHKGTHLWFFRELFLLFEAIPQKVEEVLNNKDKIKIHSRKNQRRCVSNALYLGRGINFPVALEGALKLKEISYIHAEGYPSAEMKHGPIALIDTNMPVFVIATNMSAYEKIVSNIQEVKARKGQVIAIVWEGDTKIRGNGWLRHRKYLETEEPLSPLLSVILLQLLSYYVAVLRGNDVPTQKSLLNQ